ncbi:MAG: DNA polymerase [Candidatus Bathyarchaeota archaeon BA2]|nr:MAG: DNA polymerase [Candidatus Bathyarchaeota archaeon BA2]
MEEVIEDDRCDVEIKIAVLGTSELYEVNEFVKDHIPQILYEWEIGGWTDPLGQLINWLWEQVSGAIDDLWRKISPYIDTARSIVVSSLTSVVDSAKSHLYSAISTVSSIVSSISAGLTSLTDYVYGAFSTVQIAISTLGANISVVITSAISTLSALISSVGDLVVGVPATIAGFIYDLSDIISASIAGIVSSISSLGDTFVSSFTSLWESIAGYVDAISESFSGFVDTIVTSITKFATDLGEGITNIANTILDAFSSAIVTIGTTITQIITEISSLGELLFQQILELGSYIASIFTETFARLESTIMDWWSVLVEFFKEQYSKIIGGVNDIIITLQGFVNPLAQLYTWFATLPDRMATFFVSIWTSLRNTIPKLGEFLDDIPRAITGVFTPILDFFKNIPEKAKEFFAPVTDFLKVIPEKFAPLIDFFKDIPSRAKEFFSPLVDFFAGIPDGIKEFFGYVIDFFKDIPGKIRHLGEAAYDFLFVSVPTSVRGFLDKCYDVSSDLVDWSISIIDKTIDKIAGIFEKTVDLTLTSSSPSVLALFQPISGVLVKRILLILSPMIAPLGVPLIHSIVKMGTGGDVSPYDVFFYAIPTFFESLMLSHVLGSACYTIGKWFDVHLEPEVAGTKVVKFLGFSPTMFFFQLGRIFHRLPPMMVRAMMYGMAIWTSYPLARAVSYSARNMFVVELPTVETLEEIGRRYMPTDRFEDTLSNIKLFMGMYGYRDAISDWVVTPVNEANVMVKDRFGVERAFPISLIYQLPTPSDLSRMMVHDLFYMPLLEAVEAKREEIPEALNEFATAMQMRGMNPDLAGFYYLLHFRYPSMETLFTFLCRSCGGFGWVDIKPVREGYKGWKNEEYLGYKGKSPLELSKELSKEPIKSLKEKITYLLPYAKWHDFSPFCVLPDTIILGSNKQIKEYVAGNYTVFGGKVIETYKRYHREKIVTIKAHNLLELRLTPEHKIPVVTGTRRWIRVNNKNRFILELSEPYFKDAESVVPAPTYQNQKKHSGDYVIVPILEGIIDTYELDLTDFIERDACLNNRKLILNENLAWLLGFYVAEGHLAEKYVSVSQSENREDIVEEICEKIKRIGYSPVISRHRGIAEIYIKSPILSRAIANWCGKGSKNKKIPNFILLHKDERIIHAFFEGYFRGDGFHSKYDTRNGASTVSIVLAMQLQLLLLRFGIVASILKKKSKGFENAIYIIRFRDKKYEGKRATLLEDCALFPVRRVSFEDYEGDVYDMEVENHLYLVSNVIVHNSWQKDWVSDAAIFLDMMADIPMRIDGRWMYKWAIINEEQLMHIVLARGMHPDWIIPITVGEAMNALMEERTYARTGVITTYKEGFMLLKKLTETLSHLTDVEILGEEYPVKFLPGEVALLELRARYDRAMDVLKDMFSRVVRAYADNIVTYDDFKKSLGTEAGTIAKWLSLPIEFDIKYADAYEPVALLYHEIATTSRVRVWLRYMMFRLLHRFSQGYLSETEIKEFIAHLAVIGSLTDKEKGLLEYFAFMMLDVFKRSTEADAILKKVSKGVMKTDDAIRKLKELGIDEATARAMVEAKARLYTLSISTLLSYADMVEISEAMMREKIEILGVPPDEATIILEVFKIRPIKDERSKVISELLSDFSGGYITKEELEIELKALLLRGDSLALIIRAAELDKTNKTRKYIVDGILNKLKRGAISIKTGLEELRKVIKDEAIVDALIEKNVKIYTLSVDKIVSFMEYIAVDPEWQLEKLELAGVGADEMKYMPAYITARVLSSEAGRYVTELISDFAEGIINEKELKEELDSVATLWGEVKKLGVDWIIYSPDERLFLYNTAIRRRQRYVLRS